MGHKATDEPNNSLILSTQSLPPEQHEDDDHSQREAGDGETGAAE